MSAAEHDRELDRRALTEYLSVLDNLGRVRDAEGMFLVVSQSGREYLVDGEQGTCVCEDYQYRGHERPCKHVRRVEFATGSRPIPSWIECDALDESLGEHIDDGGPRLDGREVRSG